MDVLGSIDSGLKGSARFLRNRNAKLRGDYWNATCLKP